MFEKDINAGKTPVYDNTREKIKVLLPLCLYITFQCGFSQFGSLLDNLSLYFPSASQLMLQMVVVTPSAVAIPISLFSGFLSTIWPRKKIGMTAMSIMLVGGLIPVFLHGDILFLFISSCLIGAGQGLILTTSTGLFAENFVGNDRDMALGFKQVADSVGNMVIVFAIGILSFSGWYFSYLVYLILIPILFLVGRYLPMGVPDERVYRKGSGWAGLTFLANPHYIFMCFIMVMSGLFMYVFYTNVSMAIFEKGLGDTVFVALVFSLTNILQIPIGLLYGLISRVLKKYGLSFSFAVLAIAYMLFAFGRSVPTYLFAAVIWGVGSALMQSATLVFLTTELPRKNLGLGIAIGVSLINVGIFCSPPIINGFRDLVCGNESAGAAMLIAAMGLLFVSLMELVRERRFVRESPIGVPPAKTPTNL